MKKFSILMYLSCFLLFNPFNLYGQSQTDFFNKKWKILADPVDILNNLHPEQMKAFNAMSPEQKRSIKTGLSRDIDHTTFKFYRDYTFHVEVYGIDNYHGTWKAFDNGKTIIATTSDGIEEKVVIRKIDSEQIVVTATHHGNTCEIVLIPSR